MSVEGQYRRLCRLFPTDWRERNEDDLVATLLAARGPGARTVSVGEAADLVRWAAVLRFRGVVAKARHADVRTVGRVAGLVGVVVATALALGSTVRFWISEVSVEFLLTSLVVVLVPGTGVVYTITSSIGGGWRRGWFAAVGCTVGIVPHLLAAMLGLSGVMQAGAVAFEAVRWVGVGYLVFMAASMILGGRGDEGLRLADHERGGPDGDAMGLVVRRGVLLNLLNPKLTVFFFAFLPQFLDSPPGLLDPRLVGLGSVFMLMTMVVFGVYAWTSAAVRERILGTPSILRWIQRSMGAFILGFAARLAVSDR